MSRLGVLVILGCVLLTGTVAAAAPVSSDWPALNHDATSSNYNTGETAITAQNVLKLKVKWTAPIADVSYPIVSAGKVYVPVVWHHVVHLHVLDAASGRRLTTISRNALGGELVSGDALWTAGSALQALDPSTGKVLGKVAADPSVHDGTFVDPETDDSVLIAGYTSTAASGKGQLYSVDPSAYQILWHRASSTADGLLSSGRAVTSDSAGSVFYNETSGRKIGTSGIRGATWFAAGKEAYSVSPETKQGATLSGLASNGHQLWKRVIGPVLAASDWPHASSDSAVYIQIFKPFQGVEALDATSGRVLWHRSLQGITELALANNLLFVLTYDLGQPSRIVVYQASNGKPVGGLTLSDGYFGFHAANGLMVADGMIFVRVASGKGSLLVALGKG
ncbi:MAG: PQQ-binding-like beta-propeller repeat protein [Chloroflexota bacterium]